MERIIKPLFGSSVEVNKIAIPHSKKDKKSLRYARVFFYVSNIKEGNEIATKGLTEPLEGKNEYEKILTYINYLLKGDAQFSRYCNSEIYEYTKKNQSNVLHIKGIHNIPKEDPAALAEEIKDFFQKQNAQWNIVNVYAAIYEHMGAWSNVTFATYEETVQAYDLLKNSRPKFRDGLIYGSLRNVKDPRTVVISVVRKDASEKQVEKFLRELAEKSVKSTTGEELVRKYDFFSFNIIEAKKFYRNDANETEGVAEGSTDAVQESWIEINEVPRRLIIHFFNEFTDEDIKELTNDIKTSAGYENIFLIGDSKKQLRSSHQKGHVNNDGSYVKHTELKGKKKNKPQGTRTNGPRPRGDPNQVKMKGTRPMNFNMFSFKQGGIPNVQGGMQPGMMYNRPAQIGGLGGMPMGLPGTYPPGLPGTSMTPPLPNAGNMPLSMPGVRPPMPGLPQGLNQVPLGSQPPTIGQQAPMIGGFKPQGPGFPTGLPNLPGTGLPGTGLPGLPGLPGMSNLPGMSSLPGMNLPGTKPFFPPQQGQNPLGGLPKPPQK